MNIRFSVMFAVRTALNNPALAPVRGYMHRVHIMATSPKWSML